MMASWLGCFAAGSAGTGTRGQWRAGLGRLGARGLWRGPRGAGQKGHLEEESGKWALGRSRPREGARGQCERSAAAHQWDWQWGRCECAFEERCAYQSE